MCVLRRRSRIQCCVVVDVYVGIRGDIVVARLVVMEMRGFEAIECKLVQLSISVLQYARILLSFAFISF